MNGMNGMHDVHDVHELPLYAAGGTPLEGPVTGQQKAAEASDPFVATAVTIDTPGYDGMEAMARCLVEEFARSGWPRARIERLFKMPAFAAPYAVYRSRGDDFVRTLLNDVLGFAARGEH